MLHLHNKITQAELAAAMGVSRQIIANHIKKGMPTDSIEAAKAWHTQNVGVRAKRKSPLKKGVDEDFQTARTRREIAEANLAEMKEAESAGRLVAIDAVRAAWANRVSSTREALLQIPSRMAPALAVQTDLNEVTLMLDAEIRRVLTDLARPQAYQMPTAKPTP